MRDNFWISSRLSMRNLVVENPPNLEICICLWPIKRHDLFFVLFLITFHYNRTKEDHFWQDVNQRCCLFSFCCVLAPRVLLTHTSSVCLPWLSCHLYQWKSRLESQKMWNFQGLTCWCFPCIRNFHRVVGDHDKNFKTFKGSSMSAVMASS